MIQRQQPNPTADGEDALRSAWFRARTWPALAAGLAVALAFVAGPRPPELGDRATGDGALARTVRTALGPRPGTAAIAVAEVTCNDIRTAGLGTAGGADVDEHTAFEIGSVTKALTGMLLADQVANGAVDLDQPVGAVAGGPLKGSGAGGVTLRSLAQHRAGYPRLAGSVPSVLLGSLRQRFTGGNPYGGWTPERIIDAAAGTDADSSGEFAYSNFGYAVLGTALADAADTSYGDLLDTRLLQPLGMTATRVVTDATALLGPGEYRDG